MYYYWRKIRPFLALLLLVGIVYGGIKGWMYYNARQAMEELAVASAGRVDIKYDSIETDLTGAVTVHGVSLVPAGAPQPVHIDQVRVSGPQLDFFLWGHKRDDPPPHMRLSLVGMRVALDEQLFSALRKDLPDQPDASPKGCDVGDNLDPEILRKLGFNELQMNADVAYDYNKTANSLRADMELDIAQLERLQANVTLNDVAPNALAEGMSSIPSLASMSLSYRVEPEFGRRYLAACAKRAGQDVDSFRKARVVQTLTNLAQAGVRLGPGLTQALQDYHQSWGEVHVTAEPAKPVNVLAMMFSPPQNWVDQLGIRVKLNRREITDLSFEVRQSSAEELATLLGQEPPPSVRSKPRPRYHYVYRPANVSQLGDLIGAKVRLYLNNNQPMRSGILVGLTAEEARVEQRLLAGSITAHVPLVEIVRVEVEQLEQIPPPQH